MHRLLLITVISIFVSTPSAVGEIKPRLDVPQPFSPEESIQSFHLSEGFQIQLVASVPNLADLLGIDFDSQCLATGDLLVSEINHCPHRCKKLS